MIGPALTHLLESTVFAALTALLILAFRVRQPSVRHAAWLLVAIKFALPAYVFIGLGAGMRALAPLQPIPVAWSGPAALLAQVSTMPAPVSKFPVESALLCLWLAGAIFAVSVWLRRLQCRPSQAIPAPSTQLALLRRLQIVAGVSRPVTLCHSPDLISPGLTGIWKPVICIPRTLAGELDRVEFESVLLHELAHVRRWDNLCSAAVHAIACVFWFYPLVWWIERRIAFEAERCCDDLVVRWGAPPDSYADAILKVCRLEIGVLPAGVSGIGTNLSERLEWILSERIGQRGGLFGVVAIATLAVATTIAPLATGFIANPAMPAAQTPSTVAPDRTPQPPAPTAQRPKPKAVATLTYAAAQDQKPPDVRCADGSVWYPEGTVGRMGSDRMCVADADGSPRWVPVETAGRPRVGEIVDLWAVRNEPEGLPVCKVRGSRSATECSCESGPSPLGVVVTSDRGERLVCDKWATRKTAEWRPAIQGKDYQ